jgi:hypothetical protein
MVNQCEKADYFGIYIVLFYKILGILSFLISIQTYINICIYLMICIVSVVINIG